MNQQRTLSSGIVMAGLGVMIGAFGAHGLKEILVQNDRAETFELAVRYQFYHAFALLITGVLMHYFQSKKLGYAAVFFIAGIILFSGSLYILSLTGITILGAVTPLGGVCFILGWVFLIPGISKK